MTTTSGRLNEIHYIHKHVIHKRHRRIHLQHPHPTDAQTPTNIPRHELRKRCSKKINYVEQKLYGVLFRITLMLCECSSQHRISLEDGRMALMWTCSENRYVTTIISANKLVDDASSSWVGFWINVVRRKRITYAVDVILRLEAHPHSTHLRTPNHQAIQTH